MCPSPQNAGACKVPSKVYAPCCANLSAAGEQSGEPAKSANKYKEQARLFEPGLPASHARAELSASGTVYASGRGSGRGRETSADDRGTPAGSGDDDDGGGSGAGASDAGDDDGGDDARLARPCRAQLWPQPAWIVAELGAADAGASAAPAMRNEANTSFFNMSWTFPSDVCPWRGPVDDEPIQAHRV